jgi:LSD1 subclass zinc finger protein
MFWLVGVIAFTFLTIYLPALDGTLHVDLGNVVGGAALGLVLGVALVVLFPLPALLAGHARAMATARRELQGALAAGAPTTPGGPATCRNCGAPLDVPRGTLGVRCAYCSSDNLVALPAAWVTAAHASAGRAHTKITQVLSREGAKVRTSRRRLALGTAAAVVFTVPFLFLVGRSSADLAPPPWTAEVSSPRRMIAASAVADVRAGEWTDVAFPAQSGDCGCFSTVNGNPYWNEASRCERDKVECALEWVVALRDGEVADVAVEEAPRGATLTYYPAHKLEKEAFFRAHPGTTEHTVHDYDSDWSLPRTAVLPVDAGRPARFVAPYSGWFHATLAVPPGPRPVTARVRLTVASAK